MIPGSNVTQQLGPYQKGVAKALQAAGEAHAVEAVQQGVPPPHIEQQAGLSPQLDLTSLTTSSSGQFANKMNMQQSGELLKHMLAQQAQQQPQAPSQTGMASLPQFLPAKGLFSGASLTPQGNVQNSGFLANLLGQTTTADLLEQLTKASEIQKNMQQAPTLEQQIANLAAVEQAKKEGRISQETVAHTTARGGVTLAESAGLTQQKVKREDAETIANAMVYGNEPVDFSRLYGGSLQVRAALDRKGFNVKKGMADWLATQTLVKTKNSQQQFNMLTALDSAQAGIPELKRLNGEFQRVNFTPANKLVLSTRLHGIDFVDPQTGQQVQAKGFEIAPGALKSMTPDQVAVATQFITQMNLMKDETAVAMMRGGVPIANAFSLMDSIFNPTYGFKQLDSALDQVNFNLNIRRGAITSLKPQGVFGEINVPGGVTSQQTASTLVPSWVSPGFDYQGAKEHYSDDEIKAFLSGKNGR